MSREIDEQIERIQTKLAALRQAGRKYGPGRHRVETCDYALNAPLSEAQITDFETTLGIRLPVAYREFLLRVGNGGTGPYQGLRPLNAEVHRIGRAPAPDHLRRSFPLTTPVVLWRECSEGETYREWLQKRLEPAFNRQVQTCFQRYSDSQYLQGSIELCHYGCGLYFFLVVAGPEAGNIWLDDLASEAGIFPVQASRTDERRINFLTWYEVALDRYLQEVADDRWIGEDPHYWSDYAWITSLSEKHPMDASDFGKGT